MSTSFERLGSRLYGRPIALGAMLCLLACAERAAPPPPGTSSYGATAGSGAMPSGGEATMGSTAGPGVSNGVPGETGTMSTTTGLPPGPRFPLVPMHLVPTPGAGGEDARVDLELRADGTIQSHGRLLGQLAGERILSADGSELLSVTVDGVVVLRGTPTRIRMNEAGEIVMPNGATLSFADDGTTRTALPGQPPTARPARLDGYRPGARRTAALLALLAATVAMPSGG